MRSRIFALAMVSGLLIACGGGESNGSSITKENTFGAEPTDLTYSGVDSILMGPPGVLYHLKGDCSQDGQFVYDTARSTNYLLQEGKLYLLDGDDCQARVLTGSSSTLVGKWTINGEFQTLPGTEPESEFECDEPSATDINTMGSMEFSPTQIRYSLTIHNFCWARLSAHTDEESGDSMVMVTCDSLIWKREGKQATLKLLSFVVEEEGVAVDYRFDFEGASCTRHKTGFRVPSTQACAQAYQAYLADTDRYSRFDFWDYKDIYRTDTEDQKTYNACVVASGFSVSGYEPGQ